jgi:hypothetical protein
VAAVAAGVFCAWQFGTPAADGAPAVAAREREAADAPASSVALRLSYALSAVSARESGN